MAAVLHGDAQERPAVALGAVRHDLDRAAAGVARVVEQVDQDLLQPADVAGHRGQLFGQPDRRRDARLPHAVAVRLMARSIAGAGSNGAG